MLARSRKSAPARSNRTTPAVSTGKVRSPYMVATNNGGRIEDVAGFNIDRVMAQGFGGRRLPARICSDTLSDATWLEYAFPESVIGKDDRVPIVDTTRPPWRNICHLVIDGLDSEQVIGTGWMAGPRTVLTAGHNLFSYKFGRHASRVTVVPGRRLDIAPFNYFRSTRFDIHDRWRNAGDKRFDLGVIWLHDTVGERTGWFGFSSKPDDELTDLIVNTSGYPADKRIGTQWFNSGRISSVSARILQYGLDTEPGQSGSPIFVKNAQGERIVVAVHAYGGSSANRGIRISDDVFDQFDAWIR